MTAPALAQDDYVAFCERIRVVCGIDLLQYKRGQMERRIRSWTARRGTPALDAYALRLRREPEELDAFLDRVTINVSCLWRHPEQWTALANDVLPELADRGRIRAWSAGCSYGAEAFSLAAVCQVHVPGASVEIRGTDLDRRMIERARQAEFSAEDVRLVPRPVLRSCFDPLPGGRWAAGAALRARVRFDVGDLLRMPMRPAGFDLIICRNTVIYFTEEVRDALHRRLVDALAPGGYLVVGTSERVACARDLGLESPLHFFYRKG